MKTSKVFEGSELKPEPPDFGVINARFSLLGVTNTNTEKKIPLTDDLLSKHLLFLGGIGTGKTNAIFQLVKQLRANMTKDDVMIIFDTKGDFHQEFYRIGDIVFSRDEKAMGPDRPDFWNIFKEIGSDESAEEDFNEITRTLFYDKTLNSNQPFFPNAARDLLTAILVHLLRVGDPTATNNEAVRRLLNESSPAKLRELLQIHNDLRAITSYIADDRSPQTHGVFSELQQMIRDIFVGNFQREGNLSIRQSIRNKGGRAVFIEYDLGFGNMLIPIYRLLLDLAIKESLSRKKTEGNVWFIIDEFRLVPNLQHIDDGVNFGRSLGARFIVGVQNVEQLFHTYGDALARSLLSGFTTTVAFRVGDEATRAYIQGLFGKNRKIEGFMPSINSKGMTESIREANVVEDWDVANLRVGQAIIGIPSQSPFVFQFKKY